jgi:hypothetical protein
MITSLLHGGGAPINRQISANAVWEVVRPMIEINDSLMIHCPQLGGEIPFSYCRTVNDALPCRKVIACWELRMDIAQFLKDHFSIDEMQRFLAPPAKTKIETLLDLIEKAKKIRPSS